MADIQTWPEHHFQRCHDFGVIIPHWIKERQIYTTCLWAGMGTHAVALLYIKHFVKWAYDINMKLTCYSMTDYDKTCQRLLKTFRPRCLFGDLSEQFPQDLENKIRAQQTRLRNEFEDFQGTCLQKKQEKDELTLGFRLLVEELAEQTQWQWPTRAICSIRSDGLLPQEADLHPPLDKDDIWLEAISPSCVNWSKQGKRMGWLGEQSLPMILYAIGMRQRSRLPHLVMLECVPDFDLAWLTTLSGGALRFQVCELAPYDEGLPVTGPRLWAASAQGLLEFGIPPFDPCMVDRWIRREVITRPYIWMISSEDEQQQFNQHVGARDALQPHPGGKLYRPEDMLPAGHHCRLVEHRMKAARVRQKNPGLYSEDFFFDIGRLERFARSPDGLLPRQLTASMIWSEQVKRLMTPTELLASQGKCYFKCVTLFMITHASMFVQCSLFS